MEGDKRGYLLERYRLFHLRDELAQEVQFFSLEEHPQQLAQKLLALKGTKRFSRREELAQAGYDTDQQTRIMEARYLGRSDAQITGKEQLP